MFKEGDYIIGKTTWHVDNIYKIITCHNLDESEYHQRFDVKSLTTGKIVEGSYLYNGYWRKLDKNELREYKLNRILK